MQQLTLFPLSVPVTSAAKRETHTIVYYIVWVRTKGSLLRGVLYSVLFHTGTKRVS